MEDSPKKLIFKIIELLEVGRNKMFCRRCGQKNNESAKFCVSCGAILAIKKVPEKKVESVSVQQNIQRSDSQTWKTYGWIFGLIFILFFGWKAVGLYNSITETNYGNEATSIENNILSDEEYEGSSKPKVTYTKTKDTEGFSIYIANNSKVIEELNEGYSDDWELLVDGLKEKSKKLYNNGDTSYIHIVNPVNPSRDFLQINEGSILYDTNNHN